MLHSSTTPTYTLSIKSYIITLLDKLVCLIIIHLNLYNFQYSLQIVHSISFYFSSHQFKLLCIQDSYQIVSFTKFYSGPLIFPPRAEVQNVHLIDQAYLIFQICSRDFLPIIIYCSSFLLQFKH